MVLAGGLLSCRWMIDAWASIYQMVAGGGWRLKEAEGGVWLYLINKIMQPSYTSYQNLGGLYNVMLHH